MSIYSFSSNFHRSYQTNAFIRSINKEKTERKARHLWLTFMHTYTLHSKNRSQEWRHRHFRPSVYFSFRVIFSYAEKIYCYLLMNFDGCTYVRCMCKNSSNRIALCYYTSLKKKIASSFSGSIFKFSMFDEATVAKQKIKNSQSMIFFSSHQLSKSDSPSSLEWYKNAIYHLIMTIFFACANFFSLQNCNLCKKPAIIINFNVYKWAYSLAQTFYHSKSSLFPVSTDTVHQLTHTWSAQRKKKRF